MTSCRWRRALGAGALVATALLVPSATAGWASAKLNEVSSGFDDRPAGTEITTVVNEGIAVTTQSVRTASGGALISRVAELTGGRAAEFPSFDGSSTGPRAVLAVVNAGQSDQLNPGSAPFRFGAHVWLDRTSGNRSYYDNGNNVIQRGLYSGSQFKIQIDGGQPSCRVSGALGSAEVASTARLVSERWYQLTCRRRVVDAGDLVELEVTPVTSDPALNGPIVTRSPVVAVGATGFSYSTPLSVGGKLHNNLSIVRASDQFNGRLDNPFLFIG